MLECKDSSFCVHRLRERRNASFGIVSDTTEIGLVYLPDVVVTGLVPDT